MKGNFPNFPALPFRYMRGSFPYTTTTRYRKLIFASEIGGGGVDGGGPWGNGGGGEGGGVMPVPDNWYSEGC